MEDTTVNDFLNRAEAFSIATLLYTRLRRVSGRVIDVMYLVENQAYAKYVIDVAVSTNDSELQRQAERLRSLMVMNVAANQIEMNETVEDIYEAEITEEEIYRAQVSHHYIGALR
ncbi:MAG: hypothetical protein ACN6NJ_09485 [Acinetobacter sp.]